jgi:UDP-GlcNAc:undecaprenyl-phosphate GlcNAc-1-phosphate transferase
MDTNFIYLSSCLLISLLIFFIKDKYLITFSKYFNLLDTPIKRKIHKKPTPNMGGIMIAMYIFLVTLLNYFFLIKNDYYFLIFLLFFFILGLVDDIKNINPYLKSIFIIFFLIFFIKISDDFIISRIYFESFNYQLLIIKSFGVEFSFFITILCIMLLINAINMIDGVNGNCLVQIIIFLFVINFLGGKSELVYLVLIFLLLIFYKNIKGVIFIGNSGSHLLGAMLAYIIIANNEKKFNISAEVIFLTLVLPGFDMLRLFIQRIVNKRNPFFPDLNHFHHYIYLEVTKKNITKFNFINIFLICLPIILHIIFKINFFIVFSSWLVFYFLIIILRKKIII